MSQLAELSAMASVLEDTKRRITLIAESSDTPEQIIRDLFECERLLASTLRRLSAATRALAPT